MNSYLTVFYLAGTFVLAIPLIYLAFRFRDAASDFESKLTGIWTNESGTMRILVHNTDSIFQGEVVWVDTRYAKQSMLGFQMIKELQLRVLAQGSTGTYVDPESGLEFPFQVWLNGNGTMKLSMLAKIKGKHQVVREEKWYQA